MIKLTQLSGQPIFFRADAIHAVLPTPTGCRVYGYGWNADLKDSALAVHQVVERSEKRVERRKVRSAA